MVCMAFYTLGDLKVFKDVLWKEGNKIFLSKEKNVPKAGNFSFILQDIRSGLKQLDEADSMPFFAVGPYGFSWILKAKPSQTCLIVICERLSELQARVLQLSCLGNRMKHVEIKQQQWYLHKDASPRLRACPEHHHKIEWQFHQALHMKLPPVSHKQNTYKLRELQVHQHPITTHRLLWSVFSVFSVTTGFEYPSVYTKEKKKMKAGSEKAVPGTSHSKKLKGAPKPSRDVFVYSVAKGTDEPDIQYLCDNSKWGWWSVQWGS